MGGRADWSQPRQRDSVSAVMLPPFRTDPDTCATEAKVEAMLALAELVGVDLDALWIASRRLAEHEAAYDRALGSSKRTELERLIAEDVSVLATAYRRMERAVERMPSA
jgi:hypothetical protein